MEQLEKNNYVLLFKSRQIGASWSLAAYAAWICCFSESVKVLELSKKEDDAAELLEKTRFIISQHPEWLKLKLNPDQQGTIGLPATYSKIQALPSTKDAGRSTDATLVICDEWEYHPYAEENFAAVKPTIDAGGKLVAVSTVDKLNQDSFPKRIWRGSKAGDNNFKTIFYGWTAVPTRDDAWYKRATQGLPDWQREAEYPATEDEALSLPSTTCFFDMDALKEMIEECRKPIDERYGGKVKIYQRPVADRKYCFAIDTSEGQDDPSCGVIADWQSEMDVASFHGKMSYDEQAKIAFELYQEYNEPFMAVERNAGGMTLIEKLSNMGVDNWYHTSKDKLGWQTNTSSRPVMLNELAEGIYQRLKRIPMREAIQEFLSFSWIDGKPQAVSGAHDDWVIAHAILGQIRKEFRHPATVRVHSGKYREGLWQTSRR